MLFNFKFYINNNSKKDFIRYCVIDVQKIKGHTSNILNINEIIFIVDNFG